MLAHLRHARIQVCTYLMGGIVTYVQRDISNLLRLTEIIWCKYIMGTMNISSFFPRFRSYTGSVDKIVFETVQWIRCHWMRFSVCFFFGGKVFNVADIRFPFSLIEKYMIWKCFWRCRLSFAVYKRLLTEYMRIDEFIIPLFINS